MRMDEINIRDPYILTAEGKYWLYGTRGPTCWGEADGFDVYESADLKHFEGPKACFQNDGTFWADRNYWAPEVHPWRGAYYMFASFKRQGLCRGTAILRAERPQGPFVPWSDGRVTPGNWECLDGTFYVSRTGEPYMVFCHEWVQCGDGEICALPLTEDLKGPAGAPRVLFRASEAPWCKRMHHSSGKEGYVTDGPFMWRTSDGTLLCLWASFSDAGYTEAQAVSDNGEIDGHFRQIDPVFMEDGGHGMVFRTREGDLRLILHSPNEHLKERPVLIPLEEHGGRLDILPEGLPAWYTPLRRDLEGMARELEAMEGWKARGEIRTLTPSPNGQKDTRRIQEALDAAGKAGGGTVKLTQGDFVSGTLEMRSGVCLWVDRDARLLASTDLGDYPEHHARRLTVQDTSMGMHQSLIFAEGCRDICLRGGGVLDGRGSPQNFPGEETAQGTPGRPFLMRFIDCVGVEVRDVTLRNAACWMQNYLNCENLILEDLRVENHANYNNDGMDIDGCRNVRIRRCHVTSGDDALCFKGAGQAVTDRVLAEDCVFLSACNAVKIGTDTQGDFRNILVRRCRIGGLETDPSGLKHPGADSAVSLEMMDGGCVEKVLLTDLEVTGAFSPVFMRLDDRGRVKPGEKAPGPGTLRYAALTHWRGRDCGPRGSYLLGMEGRPLEDLLLWDIHLRQKASVKPLTAPEEIGDMHLVYPDAHMIDPADAPAYALWARHVRTLTVKDLMVTPEGEEKRPEFLL